MGALDDLLAGPAPTSSGGKLDELLARPLSGGSVQQGAGDIPAPGEFKRFLPKVQDLPEIGMATLAAMKFAGTKTIPGAAAVGAASMLGEAGTQVAQKFGVLPGEPPQNPMDIAKRLGAAGLRGIGGEMIGRGIGKLFTPFSGSVTPEIKQGVEAAKRSGVEPPLSAMTESKPVQALERMAEFGPFGGPVTAQRPQALRQLEEFTNRISDGIAPDSSPDLVGELAKNKVKAFETVFRNTRDKLYDLAFPLVKDRKPELSNTTSTLQDIIERRSGELEPAALSQLKGLLKRITEIPEQVVQKSGGVPGFVAENITEKIPGKESSVLTYQQLRNTRSNLGKLLDEGFGDPGLTGIKSEYKRLYGAMTQDLDATASGVSPQIAKSIKDADSFYSTGIARLQDSLLKAINKRAEKSPESLHTLIFRKDSPTLIKAGREILGEDGFNQIRKQWFDDLVNKSKSIVEGEEIVSPAKLANNLRRMGGSLPEIVADNPQLAQKMADLSDVSKLLTRGTKVTGGSQTGFIISTLKDIRGILAAPLIRTEMGREFLTTGFPRIGKAAARAVQPTAQLGVQGFMGRNEQ